MGLPISDAICLLMLRVADERHLPFEVKVPNATTRKAIAELEAGKRRRFDSIDALIANLLECGRLTAHRLSNAITSA